MSILTEKKFEVMMNAALTAGLWSDLNAKKDRKWQGDNFLR